MRQYIDTTIWIDRPSTYKERYHATASSLTRHQEGIGKMFKRMSFRPKVYHTEQQVQNDGPTAKRLAAGGSVSVCEIRRAIEGRQSANEAKGVTLTKKEQLRTRSKPE